MPVPMSGSPWPGVQDQIRKYEVVQRQWAYRTGPDEQYARASCRCCFLLPLPCGPQGCRSFEQTLTAQTALTGLAGSLALQGPSQRLCVFLRLHTHATLIQFNSTCTMLIQEPTKPPQRLGPPPLQLRLRPDHNCQNLDCILIFALPFQRTCHTGMPPPMRAFQARRGSALARQMKCSTRYVLPAWYNGCFVPGPQRPHPQVTSLTCLLLSTALGREQTYSRPL